MHSHSPGTIRMKPDPDPILDVGGSPASSDTASPYTTYPNYEGLHNGGGASMVTPAMITDSPGKSTISVNPYASNIQWNLSIMDALGEILIKGGFLIRFSGVVLYMFLGGGIARDPQMLEMWVER